MKNLSGMDIMRIEIAHEFTLNAERSCEYPTGRGSFGLVLVIDGEAEYRFFGGECVRVSEGDVLMLSQDAAYRITTFGDFHHYTVNFTLHNNQNDQDLYWKLKLSQGSSLFRLFARICEVWRTRAVAFELRSKSLLYEILCVMEQEKHEMESTPGGGLLRAKAYIDKNFSSAMDIQMLARVAQMSPTNFRRRFHEVFGETAMQYRDGIRLALSKQYLASGYYNVSETARAVGFEDVSYFVRFFKKHVGAPPGAFIKK